VIDPFIGMAGRTNLLTTVRLRESATDWTKSADEKRLYVTLNKAGKVAVVDTETFKLLREVDAGEGPVRTALQPDGQLLWVGNDAPDGQAGTVTVVDGTSHEATATIQAKPGLGPMRFTRNGRWGLILNSRENAVHMVDTSSNRLAHSVAVGEIPYQIALTRGSPTSAASGRSGSS
jgi:YVTN family beta-propeller protein